jgi:hypothetical protein
MTQAFFKAHRRSLLHGLLLPVLLLLCFSAAAEKKDAPVGANKGGAAGPAKAPAATGSYDDFLDPEPGGPGYDETSIFLNVQRVGGTEMGAVIKARTAYLPITDLFAYLKIKTDPAATLDSVTGYFINPESRYCIDNVRYLIRYQGKSFQLEPSDLIQTETNLYLRLDYFRIFGLSSSFDFSNLTVKMSASMDLPAVRDMQLAQLHRNLSRLKGEQQADTFVDRNFPVFNLGALDWSLTSTQQSDGLHDLRAGVALGAVLAGGEANVALNYSSQAPFDERQQFYQWRYANNDHKLLRQVTLGRIFARSSASIIDPVVGVQVTNAPTSYRKSAGSYRLSRFTQPGWTVELYVNNVLVDFTKSDASGFFSFDVPLVYGTSNIRLRYYGPYGEERNWEDNISMPFNFLPKKEFEYTATAGMVDDTLHSRYGRASLSYGVSRFLTITAGNEYLSSVRSGANMPFASMSLRLHSSLMFIADYVHGVKGSALLNYRLPGNGELELSWIKYDPAQRALLYNYREERKLSFTLPFSRRHFSGLTRLLINQTVVTENTSYDRAEWLLSAAFRNMSANLSTYLVSSSSEAQDPPRFDPYIYSNASLAYRFGHGFTLMPQAQYSFKDQRFISAKCEMEKYFLNRGYVNIACEQNFMNGAYGFSAGMRYDLSFARVGVAARRYDGVNFLTTTAAGSMMFDAKTGYVGVGNRSAAGRAGISILPFLDINGNGQRDAGEPKVPGLRVTINSGRVQYSMQDTLIRLFDLEPYTKYFVDLSQNNFENINWQVRNKTMSVAVSPNQLRLIEVPVTVMSEASGTVYLSDSMGRRGIGRIEVNISRPDGSRVAHILTDRDGYYSYMGLTPGDYLISTDEEQLHNLGMKPGAPRRIHISATRDGGFLDGLNLEIAR